MNPVSFTFRESAGTAKSKRTVVRNATFISSHHLTCATFNTVFGLRMMNELYRVQGVESLYSPSLLLFKDLIRQNIASAVKMTGGPAKLRPHVKTHKTREAGITKQKCATIAEAEMLAQCGVPDVLLAYPLVGPNIGRFLSLMRTFPATKFSTLIDHPRTASAMSEAATKAGQTVEVLLDVNVGQNRTGIAAGPEAIELYAMMAKLPGLRAIGLHVYDGHNHQEGIVDRESAVLALVKPVFDMRAELEKRGFVIEKMVCGGTPTFPVWAKMDFPGLECSPGTFVLHDTGYGHKFTDMSGFTPAAVLLTRVVSKPLPNRLTLDLGNKAVAADPPLAKRAFILGISEFQIVVHNEEHLVIETPDASKYEPGDHLFALPGHVCPTCALHREVYVVEGGRVVGTWTVASRDRVLSV